MQTPFHIEWWRSLWNKYGMTLAFVEAVIIVAAVCLYFFVESRSPRSPSETGELPATSAIAKIWTCSMHPQIRRNQPGKCPLCGMDLVAVTASAGGMRTVTISPTARKLMRIETSPVERRYVSAEIRMVGKVDYDETKVSHITAWVSGRLDRLYVNYPGIEVKEGDHLVYIYSEELYGAQEELIQALKHRRERPRTTSTLIKPIDLVKSSREKLRLLGLTAAQIQEIEERGTPAEDITIYSPISGVVIEKLRQEGDRVRTGDRIYIVADLKQVWVKLDAYESDLQWLRYGQEVEFTTKAYPGETFTGRIAFIDRVLHESTRTAKVRVNVSNLDGRLKPGMFVRTLVRSRVASGGRVMDANLAGKWISPMHPEIVKDRPGDCDICGMPLVRAESLGYTTAEPTDFAKPLVIPVSAALVTGTRAIVYVEAPTAKEPTFEGREIVLGPRAGDYYLVRSGLKEGELVVTNGNFKLDSALQISAKPSMMTPEGGGGGGHDHGGGSGDKTKPGETDSHQMALPSPFKSQFENFVVSYDQVTAALEGGELAKLRAAFQGLGEALNEINGKQLTGHAKMQWGEFAMLLQNDVVEGREVASLKDADNVYLALKRHVERVRGTLGLHDREPQVARLEVPAAFVAQLSRLWKVYLPVGRALADDNLAATQQIASGFQPAVDSMDAGQLEGAAATAWRREQKNLAEISARLNRATDIEAARSAFALLSDEMVALAKSFGVGGDVGSIFELRCPMAFKGRGASWLQSDDKTRNPYFGATMLKCADQVKQIAPLKEHSAPAGQKAHDHKHP